MNNQQENQYQRFQDPKQYSDSGFWQAVKKISGPILEKALLCFYAMKDPLVPARAKLILVGALAYLICPIDLIPDFIPVVGFTDDLGAIVLALAQVAANITPHHHQLAHQKIKEMGL